MVKADLGTFDSLAEKLRTTDSDNRSLVGEHSSPPGESASSLQFFPSALETEEQGEDERFQVHELTDAKGKRVGAQIHDTAYCWNVVEVFRTGISMNAEEVMFAAVSGARRLNGLL